MEKISRTFPGCALKCLVSLVRSTRACPPIIVVRGARTIPGGPQGCSSGMHMQQDMHVCVTETHFQESGRRHTHTCMHRREEGRWYFPHVVCQLSLHDMTSVTRRRTHIYTHTRTYTHTFTRLSTTRNIHTPQGYNCGLHRARARVPILVRCKCSSSCTSSSLTGFPFLPFPALSPLAVLLERGKQGRASCTKPGLEIQKDS
eukprot:690953-Pelagomonas_calceolata.AAC.10